MKVQTKGFIAALLVILCFAAGYYVVYAQWQNLANSQAQADAAQQQNDTLTQASRDIQTFLAKYQSNSSRAEQASRALPVGEPDVPGLLALMSSLTADSGLGLKQLNITELSQGNSEVKPGRYQIATVGIDMIVTGGYPQIMDFLRRCESNLRLMDVTGAIVDVSENGNIVFSTKIQTYYQVK